MKTKNIINIALGLLLLCNSVASIAPCFHFSNESSKEVAVDEAQSCCAHEAVVKNMKDCCCEDENTCQAKNDVNSNIAAITNITDLELNDSPFNRIAHHSTIDLLLRQEYLNSHLQLPDFHDVKILMPSTALTKQYCVWII